MGRLTQVNQKQNSETINPGGSILLFNKAFTKRPFKINGEMLLIYEHYITVVNYLMSSPKNVTK